MLSIVRKGNVSNESFFGLDLHDAIRNLIRIRMPIRASMLIIIKRIRKRKMKRGMHCNNVIKYYAIS